MRGVSGTGASGKRVCSSIYGQISLTCRERSRMTGGSSSDPSRPLRATSRSAPEMAHGVMGDPFVASADKGERLFRVLVGPARRTLPGGPWIEPPKYREFGSHCP